MAAIQDLVLTFCPKMHFVPQTKETETLDACITRATLNAAFANPSPVPSPLYNCACVKSLQARERTVPDAVMLEIVFLRQHSKVMTDNTVWKNLCSFPGFGFWRSLRLLCLISLILLKLP